MVTSLRTAHCTEHGHKELTLQLVDKPVPGSETWLVAYLERAVASGSKFLPGQTIQLGWSTLRVIERGDGTLGLEERVDLETWRESVTLALWHTWTQKEVAASFGLVDELQFPQQEQDAMVARCALETDTLLLTRISVDEPSFSGWGVTCAQDHEHGERGFVPLLEVTARLPFLAQFVALPAGTSVLVIGPGRIRAHAFRDGAPLAIEPGSYVAALNEA